MASAGGGKKEGEPAGQLLAKQGSKLHAALLSKEAAAQLAAPSFRVYYPVSSAGAVPFLWESQPGTPKNDADSPSAAAGALTPPLTPPPSYFSSSAGGAGKGGRSRSRKPGAGGGLLGAIRITLLRRRNSSGGGGSRTTPVPCSSAWSSSSWSSSSSSSNSNGSATMSPVFTVQGPAEAPRGHHRRAFSAGAGTGGDEDDAEEGDATPRCFWTERECCERRVVVKGCGVAVAVRNALATVVGGKPSGRRAAATSIAAA